MLHRSIIPITYLMHSSMLFMVAAMSARSLTVFLLRAVRGLRLMLVPRSGRHVSAGATGEAAVSHGKLGAGAGESLGRNRNCCTT